jgi:hypothetical protein
MAHLRRGITEKILLAREICCGRDRPNSRAWLQVLRPRRAGNTHAAPHRWRTMVREILIEPGSVRFRLQQSQARICRLFGAACGRRRRASYVGRQGQANVSNRPHRTFGRGAVALWHYAATGSSSVTGTSALCDWLCSLSRAGAALRDHGQGPYREAVVRGDDDPSGPPS